MGLNIRIRKLFSLRIGSSLVQLRLNIAARYTAKLTKNSHPVNIGLYCCRFMLGSRFLTLSLKCFHFRAFCSMFRCCFSYLFRIVLSHSQFLLLIRAIDFQILDHGLFFRFDIGFPLSFSFLFLGYQRLLLFLMSDSHLPGIGSSRLRHFRGDAQPCHQIRRLLFTL